MNFAPAIGCCVHVLISVISVVVVSGEGNTFMLPPAPPRPLLFEPRAWWSEGPYTPGSETVPPQLDRRIWSSGPALAWTLEAARSCVNEQHHAAGPTTMQ